MLPEQHMKSGHGYALALALGGIVVTAVVASRGGWWSFICLAAAIVVTRRLWQWTTSDAFDAVSRQLVRTEWVVLCVLLGLIAIVQVLGWGVILALVLIVVYGGFALLQESHRIRWFAEHDR